MVVDAELQELLGLSVRRFVEHHRSEFEALQSADHAGAPSILGNASHEAGTLGWLGSLTEHDATETDAAAETFARLLATVVRELARGCPAFALRLLTHHYVRVCVLSARPRHPIAVDTSRNEWLGLEAGLSDPRRTPTLRIAQRGQDTTLCGNAHFIVGGDLASQWLASVRGLDGTPLLVLLRRDTALRLEPVATLGLTAMGAVDSCFTHPGTTSFEQIAAGDGVESCLARANRIVGLSYVMLLQELVEQSHAIAQSHAMTRQQNGTVLARIPAVACHLHTAERAIALMRATARSYEVHSDEGWSSLPELIRVSRQAADSALQVLGGAGYIVGHGAERCWRDVLQLGELLPVDPW